jgi:hypothetical protein
MIIQKDHFKRFLLYLLCDWKCRIPELRAAKVVGRVALVAVDGLGRRDPDDGEENYCRGRNHFIYPSVE